MMTQIKSIRDFAKSHYTVCFLIAAIGFYILLNYGIADLYFSPESDSENATQYITSKLTEMQEFLCCATVTDIVKLVAFLWILIFLSPVFSGNNWVSLIIGAAFILIGVLLLVFLKEPVYTIGNNLLALLILYFGWYIIANFIGGDNYSSLKTVFCFLISRMFLGYCCFVSGIIILHRCFTSYDVFVNFTTNGNISNFLWGNGLIIVGMLLLFAKRLYSGFIVGLLTILFCLLMILQFPTLVLLFSGHNDLIGTYYSNVAFHWSMIVAVVLYLIVGIVCIFSGEYWKSFMEDENSANTGNEGEST